MVCSELWVLGATGGEQDAVSDAEVGRERWEADGKRWERRVDVAHDSSNGESHGLG